MYKSLEEIALVSQQKNIPFWQVILEDDCKERMVSPEQSKKELMAMYQAMKEADAAYDAKQKSRSGMVGGNGQLFHDAVVSGKTICGPVIASAIEKALKMGESNACMKRIVAAPTAGACGVVPAVYLSIQEQRQIDDERMLESMYIASGVGGVIANRAFLAGAAGGCQAEIGSASGMAAAAICGARGGSKEQMGHACAMALKNLMGLVCDPVAGLVEVPCVKRNVGGAVNALAAADMALAGIISQIPVDQVIDAMGEVGMKMDVSLRETSMGGVATSPKGLEIAERLGM